MDAVIDEFEQRRVVKVARMYHSRRLRQNEIGARLGISQSSVSRLLELGSAMGIVRTLVVEPDGLYAQLEDELERTYGLREAHVFDVGDNPSEIDFVRELGLMVAKSLQAIPLDAEVVGFTSWSRTFREAVRAMQPIRRSRTKYVVEMLGDVGPPQLQHETSQVTQQLASLTGAKPVFLRIPGIAPSTVMRDMLLRYDLHAQAALKLLDRLQLALVGIGPCEIVPPLVAGDPFFTEEQFQLARSLGAVGQLNLRFIREDGSPVHSELDDLVVGVTLEQLRAADRTLAVAGGPDKYLAIRGALLGGWVNTLVTDVTTAEYLIGHRVGP